METPVYTQYAESYRVQVGYYTYYYSYNCGWGRTCYGAAGYPVYGTEYVYNKYEGDGETDVVIADFGDQQVSGSTNNPDTYINTVQENRLLRNRYYDRNEWGDVSDSVMLSEFSLNDLMSDGILDYNFTIDSGHFDSLSLFLDLDYDTKLKPVDPADSVAVPEPGTLGLTGLGLLGILAARRKSAKKK
ncbi:PEP-CTERM sorting domain-containing protein [Marinobacter salinexigens]|uniref:PEP-CTERM sorting domain-containing protein n=2 Tax=Marinobacter salinexigens TaxID=2919747 RepID=A0A5B0VQ69_9GAMM|nr:PEP-CTERM sorting domain-containing protein [Marinobacter salinexigens]